jgi:hypothetical protein
MITAIFPIARTGRQARNWPAPSGCRVDAGDASTDGDSCFYRGLTSDNRRLSLVGDRRGRSRGGTPEGVGLRRRLSMVGGGRECCKGPSVRGDSMASGLESS